jgi:Holliday junction resolvase RusA-like endonuclease
LDQRARQEIKSIKGAYTLKLILSPPDKRRRDIGNYEKAVSDLLQLAGIIENDRFCTNQSIVWGSKDDARYGARVILSPVDNSGT